MDVECRLPWDSPVDIVEDGYFESAFELSIGQLYNYLCRFFQLASQFLVLNPVCTKNTSLEFQSSNVNQF